MTTTESMENVLAASALFTDVAAQTLREVMPHARSQRAAAGQILVLAGQPAEHLYLVAEGAVRLAFFSAKGSERTVARLPRLKVFGLAELFSGRPYRYNVEAVDEARLVAIPGRVIRSVSANDNVLMQNMLAHLSRHFDALAQDIGYSMRYDALQRVVSYLLGIAGAQPVPGVEVVLPMQKSIVASRLGLTPETFSRSLMTLSARTLIDVHGRHIVLHDIGRLQALLDAPPEG